MFFAFPHHGRHRPLHDRGGAVRRIPVVARHTCSRRAGICASSPCTWWTGFVAVIAGWVVTESGRQPWLVHGILRTADAISPVPAASIAGTLALFVLCYGIVFSMGIYYINRLIAQGPKGRALEDSGGHAQPSADGRRRRGRDAIDREATAMEWYLPVIWAALIGTAVAMYVILDGFDLGIGILFPFAQERKRARPDDALDRAVLGRQRNLARARRRRTVGRVSDRLCRDHAGVLSAGDRDAAGVGVPRRRVRIPPRVATARSGGISRSSRARRSPRSRKA